MHDRADIDDLRCCSFKQFIDYAFDRPVPKNWGDPHWWHADARFGVEILVNPTLQVHYASRLFQEPLILREWFSPKQIDQGFWFLGFVNMPECAPFFAEPFWSAGVDLDSRMTCAREMFCLYEKLFAPFPSESATEMWWDLLAGVLEKVNTREVSPHPNGDSEQVRQEMVRTLERILGLDQPHCQHAALHGLNHVALASERALVIDRFLTSKKIDSELAKFALVCRAGTAH